MMMMIITMNIKNERNVYIQVDIYEQYIKRENKITTRRVVAAHYIQSHE